MFKEKLLIEFGEIANNVKKERRGTNGF